MITRIGLGALVFLIAAALDFADTNHKIAVERRDGHRSGLWSVAMYLLGLVGLVSVLDVSRWYVIPEAVGLYVGSRIAMDRATWGRARSPAGFTQHADQSSTIRVRDPAFLS